VFEWISRWAAADAVGQFFCAKAGESGEVRPGQRHSGRSMLRPYGVLLRQGTSEPSTGQSQKSRPFAKSAQDESLWGSRDGPGATKNGSMTGIRVGPTGTQWHIYQMRPIVRGLKLIMIHKS
jgi:hypothetical protein